MRIYSEDEIASRKVKLDVYETKVKVWSGLLFFSTMSLISFILEALGGKIILVNVSPLDISFTSIFLCANFGYTLMGYSLCRHIRNNLRKFMREVT